MEHIRDLGPKAFGKKPTFSSIRSFVSQQPKHMVAIYPLFGMLSLAFALAGITAARHLAVSPAVIVDKKKRAGPDLPELTMPEKTARAGEVYIESSPFYKLVKGSKVARTVARIQLEPPVLPGDDSPVIGGQGAHVRRGGAY